MFIRAEHLKDATPKEMANLRIEGKMLPFAQLYVGREADSFRTKSPRHPLLKTFLESVSQAYITTGLYLQKKLPLENPILQSLSAVDPILRGHSQAVIHLKKLATNLQHFTDPESDVHLEIMGYSVSPDLASFSEGEDIVTWWAKVFNSQKFPALSKVVKAALSIFHGPLVEASFNLMGDIIDPKSSNMAIPTFNAFQTVKYTLKSGNVRHSNF